VRGGEAAARDVGAGFTAETQRKTKGLRQQATEATEKTKGLRQQATEATEGAEGDVGGGPFDSAQGKLGPPREGRGS